MIQMCKFRRSVAVACAAACLALATNASAGVIRCQGQGVDTYWNIQGDGGGLRTWYWQNGQWVQACQDGSGVASKPSYAAGPLWGCAGSPEQYRIEAWPGTGAGNSIYLSERWFINRVTGEFDYAYWAQPNQSNFTSRSLGKCSPSAEPVPQKALF